MGSKRIRVIEIVPAVDEVWQLRRDEKQGYLYHSDGIVGLGDVTSGAKLRPHVQAVYASGKATNVARVFEAFLQKDADTAIGRRAREEICAQLVTFLPGRSDDNAADDVRGEAVRGLSAGGVYVACLQNRDFQNVQLSWRQLPPAASSAQTDRRCPNITAADGDELVNFSPYLYWEEKCIQRVLEEVSGMAGSDNDIVALAGSLPRVDGEQRPRTYADIIRALRQGNSQIFISLDVGGAPVNHCLTDEGPTAPSILCINTAEYRAVPRKLWETYNGIVVVHDARGCRSLTGADIIDGALDNAEPDVAVPQDVNVVQTICAGDAAHGGLLLGIMLYGADSDGLHEAMLLSQACAITVVESEMAMRGLTAETVERNLRRLRHS